MKLVFEPLEMTVVRWLMGGCVWEKFKLVGERLRLERFERFIQLVLSWRL